MIEIKNLRKEEIKNLYDFRIDRETCLGNPFHINSKSNRESVCDKYYIYFHSVLLKDEKAQKILNRMLAIYSSYGRLRLFCWCTPKRCHGETIKNWVMENIDTYRKERNYRKLIFK